MPADRIPARTVWQNRVSAVQADGNSASVVHGALKRSNLRSTIGHARIDSLRHQFSIDDVNSQTPPQMGPRWFAEVRGHSADDERYDNATNAHANARRPKLQCMPPLATVTFARAHSNAPITSPMAVGSGTLELVETDAPAPSVMSKLVRHKV